MQTRVSFYPLGHVPHADYERVICCHPFHLERQRYLSVVPSYSRTSRYTYRTNKMVNNNKGSYATVASNEPTKGGKVDAPQDAPPPCKSSVAHASDPRHRVKQSLYLDLTGSLAIDHTH